MKLAPNEALADLFGLRPESRPAPGDARGAQSFDPLLSALLGGDPSEEAVALPLLPAAAPPSEDALASEAPVEDEVAAEELAARATVAAPFQGTLPVVQTPTGGLIADARLGSGAVRAKLPDGAESGAERIPPLPRPLGPGSPIATSRPADPEASASPTPLPDPAAALRPVEAFGDAPAGARTPAPDETEAGLRAALAEAQSDGSNDERSRVAAPETDLSPRDRAMAGERAPLAATPLPVPARGLPPKESDSTHTHEIRGTEAAWSRSERAAPQRGNEPRPSEVEAPVWRGSGAPPAAAPQPLAESLPDPSASLHGNGPALDALQSPAGSERDPRAVVATTRPAELPGRIAWLADQGGGNARIRLDPPQLGEIDVSVRVRGQQVEIVIQTEHAEVRQLMGESRERLAEALALKELRLDTLDLRVSDNPRGGTERGGEQGLAAREEQGDRSLYRDDARQRRDALGGGEASLALASRQNLQRTSNTGVDLRV